MKTNAGKRIHWQGDMANDPKSGVIISDDGCWMTIRWDDGRSHTAPSALATSPRWKVL